MPDKNNRSTAFNAWTASLPWSLRPSIYEHIRANLLPDGALDRAGFRLPDEPPPDPDRGWTFGAGSLDGLLGHHVQLAEQPPPAEVIVAQLAAAVASTEPEPLGELYTTLRNGQVLRSIDAVLSSLAERGDLSRGRVAAFARWLARSAADREPVKFAMAVLGLAGGEEDAETFMTLGRHEEFTLYAVVALVNSHPHSEELIWRLAQSVHGWGRIHIIERLRNTDDPRIKEWMLRGGYRNSILEYYTAFNCAAAGDLAGALANAEIDDDLFDSAGELILNLINGREGPAESVDDYLDAPEAVRLYLQHAIGRDTGINHLRCVDSIRRFLDDESLDRTLPAVARWTPVRDDIIRMCDAFTSRPVWRDRIESALAEARPDSMHVPAAAARAVGYDPWPLFFERLQRGENYWQWAASTDDPDRIDRVLQFLQTSCDLKALSQQVRPGGVGDGADPLNLVLVALIRFPGRGWPVLRTALGSTSTRHRNMALWAIGLMPTPKRTAEVHDALAEMARVEPDSNLREKIARIQAGEVFTLD